MSKIKQFFRQSGLTKAQLLASALCYFLCFALFLGIVVIWNPLSISTTPTEDSQAADGPTNTSGYWTDTGRYDISWYNNPDTVTYGDGSAEKPYKISTAAQLAGLSYLVYSGTGPVTNTNYFFSGVYFEQTANIDLSAYYWQPIGIRYTREGTGGRNHFSGSYDGGNHTVSGIFTPDGSGDVYSYQGLFGYVDSSSSSYPVTIKNIGITNSYIQGYKYVGGVVGNASINAVITNCYNTGSVNGGSSYVGGVVGYANASSGNITITNCYNTGTVASTATSNSYTGGVVGYVTNATTITNCYNTGTVTSTATSNSYTGGVVGYVTNATTITNCYNTGSVSGSSNYVGGVVGYADASSGSITITNCYNTGTVSGSSYYVGGVVGYAYSGATITNCYNTGSVSGSSNYVGGVVGLAGSNTTITNCYNTGTVTGAGVEVGGVVGDAGLNTTITNCYNTGNVTSTATSDSRVGGVVGYAYDFSSGNTTITNCYNTGSVSGSRRVGGVVGYANAYSSSITITNCYNTGTVTSTATSSSYVGGVVGRADGSTATITNSYYGANCPPTVGGINGADVPGQAEHDPNLTTDTPKTLSWYTAESNWNSTHPWDFEEIWTLDQGRNDGYPSFIITYWINDPSYYSIEWFTSSDKTTYGDGSASNPYIIDSAEDLAGLSWLVYTRGDAENTYLTAGEDYVSTQDGFNHVFNGKHFKLTADIDLSAHYWQPIGIQNDRQNNQKLNLFSGNFNGDGHTISGLYTPPADYLFSYYAYYAQGLFGVVSSYDANNQTSIENLNIQNASIQGCGYVGALVGGVYTFSGDILISNISSSAIVDGSGQHVGGIVGMVDSSFGSGKVELLNCESIGLVRGTINVGGIVGDAGYISGSLIISKCFNSAQVICVDYFAGGIIGKISYLTGSVTISDSYNTAEVEAADTYANDSQLGGIVGSVYNNEGSSSANVSIRNCYNTGAITGSKSRVGGIIGEVLNANATITNCYNTGSVSGSQRVGGVVGSVDFISIYYSYNTGSVTSTATSNSDVGGIVGYFDSLNSTNCYYGGDCPSTVGGINGADMAGQAVYDSNLTTETPKELSWYTNSSNWDSNHLWDFAFTWKLESDVNDGYPILDPTDWWINEGNYSIEWYNNSDTDTYGDGSASNPYIIDSAEDLAGLSWLVYTSGQTGNPLVSGTDYSTNGSDKFVFADKHFLQTKNIDMSAHVWQPIGIYYTRDGLTNINAFAGNYDGGNHTVSGLSTPEGNIDKCSYQGLFGYVSASTLDSQSPSTIKNVGIINSDISGSSYVGGVVGGANYDVILTNCYNTSLVSGYGSIGGVAGVCWGEMTGCYNEGTVTGLSDVGNVGGVVGQGQAPTNCYNTGTVNALGGNVGGLAGSTTGIVSKSYNAGNIILSVNSEFGDVKVGGISTSSYSSIDCFNKGSITVTINGTSNAYCNIYGITSISGEIVTDCYNTGKITVNGGTNVTICGIAYVNDQSSPKVFNSFNLGSFSTNSSANMHPITNAYSNNCYYADNSITDNSGATYLQDLANKAKQQAWCEDTLAWDFTFCWKIDSSENNGYPIFKTLEDPTDWWLADGNYDTSWFNNSNPSLYGDGTKENPYKIKDAKDLAGLSYIIYHPEEFGLQSVDFMGMGMYNSYLVDVYFVQTGDIDLSAHTWQPIGVAYDRFTNEEVNRAFAGNYDGQGYAISGIKTPSGSLDHYSYQGLFGIATGYNDESGMPVNTELKNIIITNSSIGGTETIGSIVALAYAVDLKNCHSSATINVTNSLESVAGIIGGSAFGSVSNCTFSGSFKFGPISSGEYISGIVGMAITSTVENCDNFSSISSDSSNLIVAGIVGMAMGGTVIDCNNFGTLSGPSVAGIIAMIAEGSITNCGVFGNVILPSDNNTFAGIVYTNQNAQISNCLVDCTVRVDGDNEKICAFAQKGMSDSGTFIDLCSSNINVIGSGSVALAGIDANNSSLDDVATNSYVLISGENIETTKNITTVTETMEENFVYLDGFKNGLPVPVKTDGTNFFHMHAFGLTTGIVEKINDVFYPNLITEQVETETIYWNPEIEEPSIFEVQPIDLDVTLEAGKTYEISLIIDGQETIVTQQATYQNQADPQNSPISFGDGLNIDNLNGVNYSVMIMADCSVDVDGQFVYAPGKVFFTGFGSTNEGNIYQSVSLVLKSIREVPGQAGLILKEPITFNSVDMATGTLSVGVIDYSLDIEEGQNYVIEFTVNGENYNVTKQCFAGDSANNIGVSGALTISNAGSEGNLFVHNGYTYLMLIVSNAEMNESFAPVYCKGKSFVYILSFDEGAPQITCTLTGIKPAS